MSLDSVLLFIFGYSTQVQRGFLVHRRMPTGCSKLTWFELWTIFWKYLHNLWVNWNESKAMSLPAIQTLNHPNPPHLNDCPISLWLVLQDLSHISLALESRSLDRRSEKWGTKALPQVGRWGGMMAWCQWHQTSSWWRVALMHKRLFFLHLDQFWQFDEHICWARYRSN